MQHNSLHSVSAKTALEWWQRLNGKVENVPADKGALARLRRCVHLKNAVLEPAVIDLAMKIRQHRKDANPDDYIGDDRLLRQAALCALILSHIREDREKGGVGTSLKGVGDTPVLSSLRLRKLLSARDAEETLTQFRRVTALLGKTAPVQDLADVLIALSDPHSQAADIARRRIAFDYYGASQPEHSSEIQANEAVV